MRSTIMALEAFALLFLVVSTLAKHGKGEMEDSDDEDGFTSSTPSPSSNLPATSSSSPQASPTNCPFLFLQPDNSTTCQPTTFRWQSNPTLDDVPMTLAITNDRATSSGQGLNDNVLVSRMLTTNVSGAAHIFVWPGVDVPQGVYVAIAFDTTHTTGVFAQSPRFFVRGDSNASCVSGVSGIASDSRSPGGPGSPDSSNSDSASPDAGTKSQNGLGSPTPTGPGRAAESGGAEPKKLSPAVLGGAVAGLVVGVVMLVFVFTFPHYWKARLVRRVRQRRPGGPYYLF